MSTRGRAEKEPRISIPVPAVPVSELLAGKSQRICNSLNWFKGVTFTFWIKIDRKNIFPKINSKIYKFSVFFPARSSDTSTAGTGIEILGSCSAHPLPAATVCQQCICCPICGHHFTHWTHPDISFRFRAGGRRVKNFRFSGNSIAARVFFLPACCGLNFDATDLPNSSFEPLYPKLFRGNPEVDLVSTVWPPDLPKVRWCRFLAAKKRCF